MSSQIPNAKGFVITVHIIVTFVFSQMLYNIFISRHPFYIAVLSTNTNPSQKNVLNVHSFNT